MPLGLWALAEASAARTSSSPIPYLNSASGLSSTRTAGSELPTILTWPIALDLRKRLLHDRRSGVVDLAARQGLRGQRQDRDRRVCRVDLVIGGVLRQAGRQVGARRVDRRLHVARGTVEAAVEVELQCDIGRADRAARGHLGDIGDDAEMAFERCRHGRRHRVGAGARQRRRHRRWSGNRPAAGARPAAARRRKTRRARCRSSASVVATGRAMKGADGFILPRSSV